MQDVLQGGGGRGGVEYYAQGANPENFAPFSPPAGGKKRSPNREVWKSRQLCVAGDNPFLYFFILYAKDTFTMPSTT